MLIHRQLLVGLRSFVSVRLMTQVLSWVGTIYVIRQIGSHAMGQYGIALVVFNYLSMTYDGTLLETLIQRAPQTDDERRAVFTLVAGIGLLLAAVTVGLAGPIAAWVGDPAVGSLIMGVALALALMSMCVVPQAALAREMAFPRLAIVAAIQAVCVTATMVVLAWRGFGAWALVAGLIAGAAVKFVLLNSMRWEMTLPTVRVRPAFGYLRFGGVLFADNLLWRWYVSLDTLLLGRWAGVTALGFYNLAQQVAELPLEKISTVVNDVSLPAYASLRSERHEVSHLLLETIRGHGLIGFPAFWGIAVVAPWLVPVLFGSGWQAAVFPLIALAAVAPLRLIGSIETPAMTGLGRPRVLLRTKFIIAPIMTVALLTGCWFGGIEGAALVWLLVFPPCYAYAFRYVLRTAGLSYAQVLAAIRGPAMAAAVMVIAVLGWAQVAPGVQLGPISTLAVAIAIGVAVYTVALRLVDAEAFRAAWIRLGQLTGLKSAA